MVYVSKPKWVGVTWSMDFLRQRRRSDLTPLTSVFAGNWSPSFPRCRLLPSLIGRRSRLLFERTISRKSAQTMRRTIETLLFSANFHLLDVKSPLRSIIKSTHQQTTRHSRWLKEGHLQFLLRSTNTIRHFMPSFRNISTNH